MYLNFDVETTGLFDFKRPSDAPGQPRLAHGHFQACDRMGRLIESRDFLIRPDDWSDLDFANLVQASRVNGLTRERLFDEGVPIAECLDFYVDMIERGLFVTAFNVQYDSKIMRGELRRAGRDDLFERTPTVCTMWGLANARRSRRMKLGEAVAMVGGTLENAHEAAADCEGSRLILEHLIATGACPEPTVRYAKNRPTPETPAAPVPMSKRLGATPAAKAAPVVAGRDFPDSF